MHLLPKYGKCILLQGPVHLLYLSEGTRRSPRLGTYCPQPQAKKRAKTSELIQRLREAFEEHPGASQKELAKLLGVSQGRISQLKRKCVALKRKRYLPLMNLLRGSMPSLCFRKECVWSRRLISPLTMALPPDGRGLRRYPPFHLTAILQASACRHNHPAGRDQSYIRSPKPSFIDNQMPGHSIISSGTREHSRSTAAIPESISPLPVHRTCIRASNASGEIPLELISDSACPSRIDRNWSACSQSHRSSRRRIAAHNGHHSS